MKTTKIAILSLVAVIILGAGFFSYNASKNRIAEDQEPAKENVQKNLSLRIDFGNGAFKDFSVEFKENYTAFDLLKEASEELALGLKNKTYDIGVLVEAIDGIEGGKDNKYWMYYVNGELPM